MELECSVEDRKRAEEKLLQFRAYREPYEICCAILAQSKNPYLLYEAGRCLSFAVVREWDYVFDPLEGSENPKSLQLLSFILDWAQNCGFECEPSSRQRVLFAAGSLVRRSAAALAQQVAFAWNCAQKEVVHAKSHTLNSVPDDPGPPCPLMSKLIDHIENLIRPLLEFDFLNSSVDRDTCLKHSLLGLSILYALLDEFSYGEESSQLNVLLESHVFLRARFQDFELVRLFQNLVCVANRLLQCWSHSSFSTLNPIQQQIVFRLVSCFEMIMCWDFLPTKLSGLYVSGFNSSPENSIFRPSTKWSHIFGPKSMPQIILFFIKLHVWVRDLDTLGSRTLSCLIKLSHMSGPLTNSSTDLHLAVNYPNCFMDNAKDHCFDLPNTFHILSFFEHLNCFFVQSQYTAVDHLEQFKQSACLNYLDNQFSHLNDDIASRIANASDVPQLTMDQLNLYELPILSELIMNLVLRIPWAWEPIERILNHKSVSEANQRVMSLIQDTFQCALMSLVILDRFIVTIVSILVYCLQRLASGTCGDQQMIHETVENLFNCWAKFNDLIPEFVNENLKIDSNEFDSHVPLSLVTGQAGISYEMKYQIKKLVCLLAKGLKNNYINLFKMYLVSRLAVPFGLRLSDTSCDEEIDLEMDEDDLTASEDSLFAISLCGLACPSESVLTLSRLFDERVKQLIDVHVTNMNQSIDSLLEDLHWLLLISGYFLITGPAPLDSVLRFDRWGNSELSISEKLLVLGKDSVIDVAKSREFIFTSVSQCKSLADSWPPKSVDDQHIPELVLFIASLLRLFQLQVMHRFGSAQLVIDNAWVITRWVATYLCHNVSDREMLEPHLTTSPILVILQSNNSSPPPLAHEGYHQPLLVHPNEAVPNPMLLNSTSRQHNVVQVSFQALLKCIYLGLDKWSHEAQVLTSLSKLMNLISMHAPDPSVNLRCSAWYELCGSICADDACERVWPNFTAESVKQLIKACIIGSWAIDKSNYSNLSQDTLLLQLLQKLRDQSLKVLSALTTVKPSTHRIDDRELSKLLDMFVNCVTMLRGLVHAIRFVAQTCNSVIDMMSFVWNGFLALFLEAGSDYLILKYHINSEVLQAIFSLYSDVALHILVYLCSLPASTNDSDHVPSKTSHSPSFASTKFLHWTVLLCQNYVGQSRGKCGGSTSNDEQIVEIKMMLDLLNHLLTNQFELLSLETVVSSNRSGLATMSSSNVVDAVFCALNSLLTMITDNILTIPDIFATFYSLVAYACELRADGLRHLSECQLVYLGKLIRLGIFGCMSPTDSNSCYLAVTTDSSVVQQCLEIVTSVSDYIFDSRASLVNGEAQTYSLSKILVQIGFDVPFISDLFNFLIGSQYSIDLEAAFSTAFLNLISMYRESYCELVIQWINECTDSNVKLRLSEIFERLACPMECPNKTDHKYVACFKDQKPNWKMRSEFRQRFHRFVSDLRLAVCKS